jgi:hypothetical protein
MRHFTFDVWHCSPTRAVSWQEYAFVLQQWGISFLMSAIVLQQCLFPAGNVPLLCNNASFVA